MQRINCFPDTSQDALLAFSVGTMQASFETRLRIEKHYLTLFLTSSPIAS